MALQDILQSKKILFFSVQTFNLEKEIKSKLEKMGAEVMYFDERPANSILAKGIIRIKKSLYQNSSKTLVCCQVALQLEARLQRVPSDGEEGEQVWEIASEPAQVTPR